MWKLFALLSAQFSVVLTIFLSFIVLHEQINAKTLIGGLLITAGTFVLIL